MTRSDRASQSLDGIWDFRHEDGPWRKAQVPMPWQAQFDDLRQASGRGLYRRHFQGPALRSDQELVLQFGAVSYHATVWVNDVELGRHEGGYLPFECTIPAEILRDSNVLEVEALLPDGDAARYPTMPFAEIPHGKQSWYGPIGGLWQSVGLEQRHRCHLTHCAISADIATGRVDFAATRSQTASLRIEVLDAAGNVVAEAAADQSPISLIVLGHQPWHPDAPHLYQARISLVQSGATVDVTHHTFGFRTFETRGGQFLLNGQPFYMRGALDQDYYPEGICTPPSVEFLEDQLRKAKHLGLNLLRCHIKVPDPRYYEVADRLGMLIWTEIPNVATFTPASARRMKETMEGILARDGNHPSIVIWTLINEDWGTRLIEDQSHRDWLAGMYDWLKQQSPGRLVVDNSPCHQNFHVKSDINDFHYYRSVPERRAEWDHLTAAFAAGADWAWSPHGDAQRRGDEPLVVSEFGVWGLPHPDQVATPDGSEPWWMETGSVWGDGVAYPHGVQTRFATYRLDTVFESFTSFINAAQEYQFANLKYEIESMRAHPAIMGYVITEFTDVHWESNGLLDMHRNPRIFHDRFASINADIVIVPRVQRYSGLAGRDFTLDLATALGGAAFGGGTLSWSIGAASGQITLPAGPPCTVIEAGRLNVPLPDQPGMSDLRLTLTSGDNPLATNSVSIATYPERRPNGLPAISSTNPILAAHARALGYPVEQGGIVLTHGLDAADIAAMQAGARYVVLADGTLPLKGSLRADNPPHMLLPDIILTERDSTIWRGDWIAGFSWIRRAGAFASLPGGPILDLSFDRVVPHHVMTGFRPWEYAGSVHSGLVAGWAHKPAALIAERRVGKGGLVASTYRLLTDAPGTDPVATALFDALIQTAARLTVDP